MAENYADIAHRSWDDIPDVETLPVGTWLLRGRSATYIPAKEGDSDSTPRYLFFYQVKEPMNDVDTSELASLASNGKDYDYTENEVVKSFFVRTGKDKAAVKAHLRKHGIDLAGKDIVGTLKEAFPGTEVLSYLEKKTFVNGAGETVTDNNPTSFAPVG